MNDPLNHGITIQNKDGVTVSIFLPYKIYCDIEDHCLRNGVTFDKYFLNLYEKRNDGLYVQSSDHKAIIKESELEEVKEKVEKKIKKK